MSALVTGASTLNVWNEQVPSSSIGEGRRMGSAGVGAASLRIMMYLLCVSVGYGSGFDGARWTVPVALLGPVGSHHNAEKNILPEVQASK